MGTFTFSCQPAGDKVSAYAVVAAERFSVLVCAGRTADFLQATSAASPHPNKKLAGCGSPRRAHLVTMPAT